MGNGNGNSRCFAVYISMWTSGVLSVVKDPLHNRSAIGQWDVQATSNGRCMGMEIRLLPQISMVLSVIR